MSYQKPTEWFRLALAGRNLIYIPRDYNIVGSCSQHICIPIQCTVRCMKVRRGHSGGVMNV